MNETAAPRDTSGPVNWNLSLRPSPLLRPVILVAAVMALAMPGRSADRRLELKPEDTVIRWSLGDGSRGVHGTFKLKNGMITFDPETGKASGQVVVDLTSGESGNGTRDHKMHGSVLESKRYSEAVFIPSRVEGPLAVPGDSSVKVLGAFTIHGGVHEMTMNVRATSTADQLRATITFDVPFVAWGMKDPSNMLLKVNKVVQVSIETSGTLQ
jgi:polyisoprenoid-binding protein YceI